MVMFRAIPPALMSGVLLLCGCDPSSDTDSSYVETNNIVAKLEAKATSNYLKVSYLLESSDGGESLNLSDGDVIEVNSDLNYSRVFESGIVTFEDDQYSDSVNVSLYRDNGSDALNSSITLPQRFDITFPEEGSEVSPGEFLQITWSNPTQGNDIYLTVESFCVLENNIIFEEGFVSTLDDDGEYIFINGLGAFYPVDSKPECELTIRLERNSVGAADEAFNEESWFNGMRSSQINLILKSSW